VNRERVQLVVALGMIALWALGLFVALWDGNTMLKVVTPFMTMVIGWLFTAKASGD